MLTSEQIHGKKIPTIADRKLTKSLINFEIKQPNCTILFIFVFELCFIDCILFKIVGFDQVWTAVQQKLVTTNRKLVFLKMPNTFCRFTVQNCRYFLPQELTMFQFISRDWLHPWSESWDLWHFLPDKMPCWFFASNWQLIQIFRCSLYSKYQLSP